jgi:hypothetical protein
LFNLSDEQMEFQLLDPMSFLRFTRLEDIEAHWTKKHGKSYFGYKLSANAGQALQADPQALRSRPGACHAAPAPSLLLFR